MRTVVDIPEHVIATEDAFGLWNTSDDKPQQDGLEYQQALREQWS